jgi:D-glycero-alpha-D-manno-heptose-7-phosphate kinase
MILTRAPLRVSFFGGGTDYPAHFLKHGGAVLGSAIDQYSFITASQFQSKGLFDYTIRVTYREIELVRELAALRHVPIREALRLCGYEKDVEIHHIADLPAKTGLGSSSSFAVSLLQALRGLSGRPLSGMELAYEAIAFERKTLRESVGCQDQVFAALGGFNLIEFRREDDISVHPVGIGRSRLLELESNLMMFYTGVERRAEDVVKAQLANVGDNADRYRRMRAQVDTAHAILTGSGPLSPFGELLDAGWQEKRALHSVISNPLVDGMYEKARGAGALGGKLLGAGAGGFLLLFVPPERQGFVTAALNNYCLVRPRLAAPGSMVIFDGLKERSPLAELRKVVG